MDALEYSREEVLSLLTPSVSRWFSQFKELTEPQKYGIVLVHQSKNCLISAPTGSGKTLTAFLSTINELQILAEKKELEDRVYCLYVSPLKALANDVEKNLNLPLMEIKKIAQEQHLELPEVRVGMRTGDTPQAERSRMLRKPPHILITTPETLAIMLCSPKFVEHLKKLRWVIIDEIHELCASKRGVHLSLSLERLQEMNEKEFTRIGLSATIAPLEEVANYLVGMSGERQRDCVIVDAKYAKKIQLNVFSPLPDLVHCTQDKLSKKAYERISEHINKHRTTLIFTNTRSGTERVVHHLKGTLKESEIENIAAHHSSLSREERLDVENKLKEGKLTSVVSSTSLELGVDIGFIDFVVQLGSPKSVAKCLQRTGRSGHKLHETSESELIGMDVDDLVEVAVMTREAKKGRIDRVQIPENCLDVLSQHIVGMAIQRKWMKREMLDTIRKSYCYRNLEEKEFEDLLAFLSGSYQDLERFHVYGRIWVDPVTGEIGKKGKLVRMIYSMNLGTIPDDVSVAVHLSDGRHIGNIEEEFLGMLKKGDRFVLGGRVYEYAYARGMNAIVIPAKGMRPTVPQWFSEQLPLSWDLANEISDFRKKVSLMGEEKALQELQEECNCNLDAAKAIYSYIELQKKFIKLLGAKNFHSSSNILIERFFDKENGQVRFIFHCLAGRRVNEVFAKSIAFIAGKKIKKNVLVSVNDNCFSITIPSSSKLKIEEAVRELNSGNVQEIAEQSVKQTEALKRRFRQVAARSFMILRNYMGRRKSVGRQQMSAHMLLGACSRIPGFPPVKETYRELLEDKMDLKRAKQFLLDVECLRRKFEILDPYDVPSPFAHNLITQGMNDAVLIQDRKEALTQLYDLVVKRIKEREKMG